MHAKTESDVTSMETVTPPRSPTRRAVYYVESPSYSQQDLDKLSYGTPSPTASPTRHYHCSPIHHSRESSTSNFFSSSSLKHHYNNRGSGGGWRRIYAGLSLDYSIAVNKARDDGGSGDNEEEEEDGGPTWRFYVGCFLASFLGLFTEFSLILWVAAKSFHPHILVKVSQSSSSSPVFSDSV